MIKKFIAILLLLAATRANAQELLGGIGIGPGVDVFLRDKSVNQYSTKFPVQLSPQTMLTLRYNATNGFDFFLDATLGVTRVEFPIPDEGRSHNYLKQLACHFMAGSGPRMEISEKQSLIPFIQLGAGYYGNWGNSQQNQDNNISVTTSNAIYNAKWVVLVGGGIEWQFYAIVPSSIQLQFTYTPMNIFENPLPYTVNTVSSSTDLKLQGKMLQAMINFRVYLRAKKWGDYRKYY
ncbi:hypothetical protein ACTHGU_12355 [Chitinophagaceae bacterium MMS25-I14]